MNKFLVICGPTAVGKTALGIKLAKKFAGEIVSADSRQIYKGMDIGTGKDLPVKAKLKIKNEKLKTHIKNKKQKTLKPYRYGEIPVWLLDIVEPEYQFSVADYLKCAKAVIKDIWQRKKLPILVGGTGFYLKGVVDGIETIGVVPDWELRRKLSNCQIVKLLNLLKKMDPEKWSQMNESDRNNPRRLIRAIEIAEKTQNSKLKARFSNGVRKLATPVASNYNLKLKTKDILMIGLKAPNRVLYQRIDRRVEERAKQEVIDEIRDLLKSGYSWENSVLRETIGYKEWREYFKNSKTPNWQNTKLKEEIIQRWKYNEHSLARRQMTWFKKEKRIYWFDISKKGWENRVNRAIKKWLEHANKDRDIS